MGSAFTASHVEPASSERKRPPSSASTNAHTRPGLDGEIATPMRPLVPLGSPPASSDQESPPSTDLYRPLCGPPLVNIQGSRRASQTAAKRTRGLLGSIDRSAALALGPS